MTVNMNELTPGSHFYRQDIILDIMSRLYDDWRTKDGLYAMDFQRLIDALEGVGVTVAGDIQKEATLGQFVQSIFEDAQTAIHKIIGHRLQWLAQEIERIHIARDTGAYEISGPSSGPGPPPLDIAPGAISPAGMVSGRLVSRLTGEPKELERQMRGDTPVRTVKKLTVGVTEAAASTNTGNGELILSTLRGDGYSIPHIYASKGKLTCTKCGTDPGGFTNHEEFTFQDAWGPDGAHPDWGVGTRGTGVRTLFQVADPTAWAKRGNELANSNFDKGWSNNHPSRWIKVTGTADTDYRRGTTVYFTGSSYSLELLAGTGVLTEFRQVFSDDSGTPQEWEGSTNYGFLVRLRPVSAIPSGGGVLRFRLTDASGNTLNSDRSIANQISVGLSTLTAGAWNTVKGVFRTPENIKDTDEFRFDLTQVLTTANVFVASMILTKLKPAYAGGWEAALVAGSTPFVSVRNRTIPDYFDLTGSNDSGGEARPRDSLQRYGAAMLHNPHFGVSWPETSGTGTPDLGG